MAYPPSDYRLPEPIARLCRWCALGLGGGLVLGAAALALAAADALLYERQARVILPDGLWTEGHHEPVHLSGYLHPPAGANRIVPVWAPVEDHLGMIAGDRDRIWPRAPGRGAGTRRVVIRGTPYDALAFEPVEARAIVLPAESAVFLVDARLALEEARDRRPGLTACLAALARRGTVALFHPGRMSEYLADRRALGGLVGTYPLLFISRRPHSLTKTLSEAVWTLGQPARKPTVITHDAELAQQAARHRYRHVVWLVGPTPAPGAVAAHFPTLAKLKESLAPEPISTKRDPGR